MVKRRVALSFDVEEWFQTGAMRRAHPPESWEGLPRTSPAAVRLLLDMLKEHSRKATFFVLGWLLDREPRIAEEILAEGHELASHGYWHLELTSISRSGFSRDLDEYAAACGRLAIPVPRGFRAPSFTMVEETVPWAADELADHGYAWDSSVYPMLRHRYGMPRAPRVPFRLRGQSKSILELPIASSAARPLAIPAGGGAYMRLYPGCVHRALLGSICTEGLIPVVYSHPWEYAVALPSSRGVRPLQAFRQSFNAGRAMRARLGAILSRFDSITLGELAAEAACDQDGES